MLYCNRIDVFKGIDVNKNRKSREYIFVAIGIF